MIKSKIKTYLNFVKFEHTLFALPFAYSGMLLANRSWPGWNTFIWISLAMVGARTASMALNRIIDAEIDARNPRTANREIPTGMLKKKDGWLLVILGLLTFAIAGWALNPLTFMLLPVAVFFLTFYPYTKRFTWLCHYWLGLSIGAAAAGGWIAVTGEFALAALTLWVGTALWIAGFDLIYAILDYDFDVKEGIYSIPAHFGTKPALTISAITHFLAWCFLAFTLPLSSSSWPYGIGLTIIAIIFIVQHWQVKTKGVAAVLKSFNANLYVGVTMLIAIVLDLVLF